MNNILFQRRRFIKSSAFGLIGITTAWLCIRSGCLNKSNAVNDEPPLFYRYPSMNDEMVSSVVGASHGNIDKVKELIEPST